MDARSFTISGSSLRLASDFVADYDTKTNIQFLYGLLIQATSVSVSFTIGVLDAIKGRVVDALSKAVMCSSI